MRDGDLFIDYEAFDLGEGVVVGRVDRFVAKDLADHHTAKRRRQFAVADQLVGAALHRAGVRAQQVAV